MLANRHHSRALWAAFATSVICTAPAFAQPLAMAETSPSPNIFQQVMPAERSYERAPRYEVSAPAQEDAALPAHLRRQIVSYPTGEIPGTVIIDTPNTYLYYVLGGGRAIRYGIGVGREGFTWSGVQTVARKQEWPDWHPPAEMIARQPYLPRFMSGGPGNPLGARAMYLGNTLFRIHGTNAPSTIGQRVSSGCVRLTNDDVEDLYNRVTLGSKVIVLPDTGRRTPTNVASVPAPRVVSQPAPRYEQRVYEPRAYEQRVYDQRDEEQIVYAPRPQAAVPVYGERPYYPSNNPYFGASGSRVY
jgi:lipoprotein-anchoring transpeptidase ErfK/SrfK